MFTVSPNFFIYDSPKLFPIYIKLLCLCGLLLAAITPRSEAIACSKLPRQNVKSHLIANDTCFQTSIKTDAKKLQN